MKKRFLALTLALTMAMGMTMTAFATEVETKTLSKDSKENTTKAEYEVAQTYTVTIPSDVTVTTDGATATIKATDVLIGEKDTLSVTLKSANCENDTYYLKYSDSKIVYTIKKGDDAVADNSAVLTVTAGQKIDANTDKAASEAVASSGIVNLTLAADTTEIAKATKAGIHTDTLTFTVATANEESEE
jgi:hypothetical protein